MYEKLHDHREVYKAALEQLKKVEIPTQHGQTQRVRVKYDMDYQEVVYTLTFEALFGVNSETGEPVFSTWSYNDKLDKMEIIPS